MTQPINYIQSFYSNVSKLCFTPNPYISKTTLSIAIGAIGAASLVYSKHLLSQKLPENSPYTKKTIHLLKCAAFGIIGIGMLYSAYNIFTNTKLPKFKPGTNHLAPKEIAAAKKFGKDILTFDPSDSRDKLLYLVAEADHNGALDPTSKYHTLRGLNPFKDVAYKVVKTPEEIRDIGKQLYSKGWKNIELIIAAHGNRNYMNLSKNEFIYKSTVSDLSIFSKILKPNYPVGLFSCSTGNVDSKKNKCIAEVLTKIFKRDIIAPATNSAIQISIAKSTPHPDSPPIFMYSSIIHAISKRNITKINNDVGFKLPKPINDIIFMPLNYISRSETCPLTPWLNLFHLNKTNPFDGGELYYNPFMVWN